MEATSSKRGTPTALRAGDSGVTMNAFRENRSRAARLGSRGSAGSVPLWHDAHASIVPAELTRVRIVESFRERMERGLAEGASPDIRAGSRC
jgi:hypothetical protein